MILIILKGLLIVAVFIGAIVFHELGHLITYHHFTKKKVTFKFSLREFVVEMDETFLTKFQKRFIYAVGIVAGLIPFIWFIELNVIGFIWGYLMLMMYLAGCGWDMIQIMRTYKRMKL